MGLFWASIFIICIHIALNLFVAINHYSMSIKNKMLDDSIPDWKGTDKPIRWFWTWTLIRFSSVIVSPFIFPLFYYVIGFGDVVSATLAVNGSLGYWAITFVIQAGIKNAIKQKHEEQWDKDIELRRVRNTVNSNEQSMNEREGGTAVTKDKDE